MTQPPPNSSGTCNSGSYFAQVYNSDGLASDGAGMLLNVWNHLQNLQSLQAVTHTQSS